MRVSASLEQASAHYGKAAALLSHRYQQIKTTEALYDWAEALDQAGQKAEATAAFQDFETKALAQAKQPENGNRELIFYYADRCAKPVKALEIAKQERASRHDIATLDAYAWALFRNGKLTEAIAESKEALAVGTRDPQVLSHARAIAGASSSDSSK